MTPTRKDLASLIEPWIRALQLPVELRSWDQEFAVKKNYGIIDLNPKKVGTMIVRGQSHWYAQSTRGEAWILTVRNDHVEVRSNNENGSPLGDTVVSWHILEAADPEFFAKLERDLRAAVAYLERN